MLDVGGLIGHWGYLAILLIVVLGNVGLPVPEETALIAAGYLVWRGELRLPLVLAVGIVSAVAGDNVGYWLGRRYGQGILERLRAAIGVTPERFDSMRRFVARYGSLGVASARFIAGLRFVAGPLAGAMHLPFVSFIVGNVVGAMAFVPLAVAAGYAIGYGLGDYVEGIRRAVGEGERVILAAAAVCVGAVVVWRFLGAFRARAGS